MNDTFFIKDVEIIFANIYEMNRWADCKPYHGVYFKCDDETASELSDKGIFGKEKTQGYCFYAKTFTRPRVDTTTDEYITLKNALDICDIRNIPRDTLFKGQRAQLELSIGKYEGRYGMKKYLSLFSLQVNADDF